MVVSSEITGVNRSKCLDISTKGTVVHGGTSTDVSMEKTVLCGRMCVHDKYGMHGPR